MTKRLTTVSPLLVDVYTSNVDQTPCCGIKDPEHPGLLSKRCWLKEQFNSGLRVKTPIDSRGKACGYIE